jgi:hypothetical protein
MGKVNPFYLKGLSKKDKKKHQKYILDRRRKSEKGKYISKKLDLKSYKHRKSKKVKLFEKKYGIKISNSKEISKKIGLPEKAQKEILDKGKGAFFSSGSRPGQTPHSWAYGRLASVILKQGAYKYDKHILDKYNVKIKQPLRVKSCLSKNLTKKDKKCRRKSDGKIFNLPRKFTRRKCKKGVKGYSMRSSCAPYKK